MKALEDMGKFATVVIDPPWQVEAHTSGASHGSATWPSRLDMTTDLPLPYQQMPIHEIEKVAIPSVLDTSALVFCWTIRRYLPYTFDIIKSWRLNYRFTSIRIVACNYRMRRSSMQSL